MSGSFRWGLIGAGEVAMNFARSVRLLPDHQVVAVASRSLVRAETAAAEMKGAQALTDYGVLVSLRDIDAVYVATPAALHRPHVTLALEAGKPVLCEKPFTVTGMEARELADLAVATGTFCMEAMWMRFIPAIQALKERVHQGEIGAVRMVQGELGFPVAYDPHARHFDPEMGGGALLDLGIYPLSLAWYLLGAPVAGQMMTAPAPTGVDAQTVISLRFENGALAQLSCSFDQRLRNNAVVTGTHGTIALDAPIYAPERLTLTTLRPPEPGKGGARHGGWLNRLSQAHPALVRLRRRHAPLLRQIIRRERKTTSHPFPGFGYQYEAAEVARCVRQGLSESPVMPLAESVAILECLDLLRRDRQFGDIS